jgi:hypothetical protein
MGLFMAIGPRNDRVRVTLPSKEWIQATIDNAGVGIDVRAVRLGANLPGLGLK